MISGKMWMQCIIVYIYNESLCSVYNHDATVIMVLFMNHFGIQCIYI